MHTYRKSTHIYVHTYTYVHIHQTFSQNQPEASDRIPDLSICCKTTTAADQWSQWPIHGHIAFKKGLLHSLIVSFTFLTGHSFLSRVVPVYGGVIRGQRYERWRNSWASCQQTLLPGCIKHELWFLAWVEHVVLGGGGGRWTASSNLWRGDNLVYNRGMQLCWRKF